MTHRGEFEIGNKDNIGVLEIIAYDDVGCFLQCRGDVRPSMEGLAQEFG